MSILKLSISSMLAITNGNSLDKQSLLSAVVSFSYISAMKGNERKQAFFQRCSNLCFHEDAFLIPKSGLPMDTFLTILLLLRLLKKTGKVLYTGSFYIDKTDLVCRVVQILYQFSRKKW